MKTFVCPGCGAKNEIEGSLDEVQCQFCGTEYHFTGKEEGEPEVQVISQPQPQSDLLSERSKLELDAVVEGETHSEVNTSGPVNVYSTPSEPAEAGSYLQPDTIPKPPVYTAAGVGDPAKKQPVARWILITIGVLFGLCVICVIAVVALLIPFSQMINF